MMALEVIAKSSASARPGRRLLMATPRAITVRDANYAWDKDNPLSVESPTIKDCRSRFSLAREAGEGRGGASY